jgi:UDP-N-acetylmuramate dehydrogenase
MARHTSWHVGGPADAFYMPKSAAELIETAGLKGYRIGGAVVSRKHANFLLNEGSATAADIERLIGYVQGEVEHRHGVRLVPEVRIVGEPS